MRKRIKWRYAIAGGAVFIVLAAGTVEPYEWKCAVNQQELENGHDARRQISANCRYISLPKKNPYLDFNTKTVWPDDMAGYRPEEIMETGKIQGLMYVNCRKPALMEEV